MAYITAYFDESYESPNPRTYTVAGYVSTDQRWIKFQKRWKKVLEREVLARWREVYGNDKPLHFHMTDFDNQYSKIYGDWSPRKKEKFLQELHDIIKRTFMRSFSTGIVMADYNALSNAEKYVFGRPHICAAVNCLKQVAMWANEQLLRDPILYVFEQGAVDEKELSRAFNMRMTAEQKEYYRIENVAFSTKVKMPPLQAADVLAYETRKEVSRRLDTVKSRDIRRSIKNLGVASLDSWVYMDAAEFRKVLELPHVKRTVESPEFQAAADAHKYLFTA